ncbi:MAG: HEAT repeat domain-containing protein [Bacteroidota bacterium]
MKSTLTASQIFDLMVEQPGSAEGRDAALAALDRLDATEVKILSARIVEAARPESSDHTAFKVPFVRGYLLGQLGKIARGNSAAADLILRHIEPEREPDHWVRYWALSGAIALGNARSKSAAEAVLRRLQNTDFGPDYKSLVLSIAYLRSQNLHPAREADLRAGCEAWLAAVSENPDGGLREAEGRCQDVLRSLGIVGVPGLTETVTRVLASGRGDARTKLLAVQALARIPKEQLAGRGKAVRALMAFVQVSGNTRTLAGVRRAAVEALGELGLADAEHVLVKELRAGSLDMIKAAARALAQVIGLEKAVTRILEASAADDNPYTRNNYAIALRWMAEDKDQVADLLYRSIATGGPTGEEVTRSLMTEMGGAGAVQKLSTRKKAVDEFKEMLLGEQDRFQKRFDETMEEARKGFRIAVTMDIVVFALGIVMLVAFMVYALVTDTVDNFVGVGLGGLGTLGVVYGTLIANPRKKVFRSVNTLMNFKVIFLAYLRQLHQADQTFTRHILEDEQLTTEKLEEFTSMIGEMLEEAVEKMTTLKQQELKEKVSDQEAEYKMRSLEMKERLAKLKLGGGGEDEAEDEEEEAPTYAPPASPESAPDTEAVGLLAPNQFVDAAVARVSSHLQNPEEGDSPRAGSVGAGGENIRESVLAIQSRLLTLGYLRERSENESVAAMEAGTVVEDLPHTIAAIREFQKYVLGHSQGDGRVDPNGNTLRRLEERKEWVEKYSKYRIASEPIAPVLNPDQWISQFESIVEGSRGRPLRESEKARPGKPNDFCCWDAVQAMVFQKVRGIRHAVVDRIATYYQHRGEGFAMAEQTKLGAKYIDSELMQGRPVMVGVDDGRTASHNADNTTEHYVVIVGKQIVEGKIQYQFFDPGTRQGPTKGYAVTNQLELKSDFRLVGKKPGTAKSYLVAQVRQNLA